MRAMHLCGCAVAVFFAVGGLAAATVDTRLVEAVKNQDQKTTMSLLQRGSHVDVNMADAEGMTALLWAAHWDDLDLVKCLIGEGANVKATNRFGSTPLHEASTVGDVQMIEALLKAGANPNAVRGEGDTPLMVATHAGVPDAVKLLLEHGAAVDAREGWYGETALMMAAAENNAEVVRLLIAHGADVNAISTNLHAVHRGNADATHTTDPPTGALTALMFAARQDAIEPAKLLITAGADMNYAEPDYKFTPMLEAIFNYHYDFATLLVEKGVNVNDGSLYTVEEMRSMPNAHRLVSPTSQQDTLKLMGVLLDHGANPNAVFNKKFVPYETESVSRRVPPGTTAFFRAALAVDLPAMHLLLAKGATSLPTKDGTTPLIAVAKNENSKLVEVVDTKKVSDAELFEAMNLCLSKGDDINAAGSTDGNTALHVAASVGSDRLVQYLFDHGAKFDLLNKNGRTPLQVAQGYRARPYNIMGNGNDEKSEAKYTQEVAQEPAFDSTVALIQKLLGTTPAGAQNAAVEPQR